MARWYLEYYYTPRTAEGIEKPERTEVLLTSMTEEGAKAEAQELFDKELAKAKAMEGKRKSDDVFKYRPFGAHAVQRHPLRM